MLTNKPDDVYVPNNLVASVVAGESLVKHKPLFSKDCKFIFVAVGTSVKIYSTSTRDCNNIFNNDKGKIVSQFLNPRNHLQLITVSNSGYICYWDYEDAILIREIPIDLEVKVCFPEGNGNSFGVLTSTGDVYGVELKFQTKEVSKKLQLSLPTEYTSLCFSENNEYVATVKGNSLSIRNLVSKKRRDHLVSDTIEFTCVEWHPHNSCIATGTSIGRIDLWYDFFEKTPVKAFFHWHSCAVKDILFAPSGNYLYSGGEECVLVKWHVSSGEKSILPRMGLPICRIACSPDSSIITTCHVDNSIVLLNQNFDVIGVIQRLAYTHHWDENFNEPIPTGLLFDKQTSTIVLNGKPGHLQFYSVQQDKLIYNLDIVQVNYISKERHRKVYHLDVIKAAFDKHCRWLATVEYWNDKIISPELRLKFWKYMEINKSFCLNTTIEMPHEDIINCLEFQSTNSGKLLAVTTSDDKSFRIWSLLTNRNGEESWTCQSVGFYRGEKAGNACFAEDGSVLCVAFNSYLTLWLPNENVLRTAWCDSTKNPIRQVQFGRNECSCIVIYTTANSLSAWDTLSYTELWSVDVYATYLIGDPYSSTMAVFNKSGDIFLFKPSNPDPMEIICRADAQNVVAAIFLEQNEEERHQHCDYAQLYFMTSDQLMYTLCNEESSIYKHVKIDKIFGQNNTSLTPFGLLLAENRKSGVEQTKEKFHKLQNSNGKKIINMVLNTPSHVLPSPTTLCSAYLNILMKEVEKKLETSENKFDGIKEDVDQSHIIVESVDNKSDNEDYLIEERNVEKIFEEDFSWVSDIFLT